MSETLPVDGTVTVPGTFWARPTRGAGLVVIAAIILELLGQLVHAPLLTVAAASLVGAVIAAAAATPKVRGLQIAWELPERITAGIESTLNLTLVGNPRRHIRARSLAVTFTHPAFPTTVVAVDDVPPNQKLRVVVPVCAPLRGHWAADGVVQVEVASPLGGWVRRKTLALPRNLIVHPASAAPIAAPAFAVSSGIADSSRSGRRHSAGVELSGLRDWRAGDAAAAVHWRASARRGELVVAERELPSQLSLTIALVSPGVGPAWESRVAELASTAATTIAAGGRVMLLAADQLVSPKSARDALDWFSQLEAFTPMSASTLASGDSWTLPLDGARL